MKRTTLTLPEGLAERIAVEARSRQVSQAEVVRDALREYFIDPCETPRPLPFASVGRSTVGDLSERVDELTAEGWNRDYARNR